MPTYSTEFAEALIPGIYQHWQLGVQDVDSKLGMLFNVRNSNRSWEEMVGVGGFDPSPFLEYENTGNIGQLNFRKGYTKRFIHKEYPADIIIERKFVDDGGLTEMAFDPARNAGTTYAILKEELAADIFNNAHSATGDYALPDGQALLSGTHPAGPSNASKTFSNKVGAVLSASTLRTGRQKMMRFIDDRGQIRPSIGRTILVPPELEETARQFAMSAVDTASAGPSRDVASPDRMMNYNVISWPYLTNETGWFLIDPVQAKRSLLWFERVMPDIRYEPSKSNQVQLCYSCYTRFSYGVVDARFIYGKQG